MSRACLIALAAVTAPLCAFAGDASRLTLQLSGEAVRFTATINSLPVGPESAPGGNLIYSLDGDGVAVLQYSIQQSALGTLLSSGAQLGRNCSPGVSNYEESSSLKEGNKELHIVIARPLGRSNPPRVSNHAGRADETQLAITTVAVPRRPADPHRTISSLI